MTTNDYPMISFSDEMASPDWKKHWDFLHSEVSEEENIFDATYQSNCKNFQIYWKGDGGFGDGGRIDFSWYEIQLVGKAPNIEGKGYILFEAKLPDMRAHCLEMVEYWMTSERENDFLVKANEMLTDAASFHQEGEYELVDYSELVMSSATNIIDYVGRTSDVLKEEVA